MKKPIRNRCYACNRIFKNAEEHLPSKGGDICPKCHAADLVALSDQGPPPMFAVATTACAIPPEEEYSHCAHFNRPRKGKIWRLCAWWGYGHCTNPVACMQAHTAALARLKGESK